MRRFHPRSDQPGVVAGSVVTSDRIFNLAGLRAEAPAPAPMPQAGQTAADWQDAVQMARERAAAAAKSQAVLRQMTQERTGTEANPAAAAAARAAALAAAAATDAAAKRKRYEDQAAQETLQHQQRRRQMKQLEQQQRQEARVLQGVGRSPLPPATA